MERREHVHHCQNRRLGCVSTFTCRAAPEYDEDGPHCPYDNERFECEDCDTSHCSECGSCLNVEAHDIDCVKGHLEPCA